MPSFDSPRFSSEAFASGASAMAGTKRPAPIRTQRTVGDSDSSGFLVALLSASLLAGCVGAAAAYAIEGGTTPNIEALARGKALVPSVPVATR